MDDEKKYQEELAKEGIELSDIEEKTETEPKDPTPEEKEPVIPDTEEEPEGDDKKEPEEKKPHLEDPEKPKKRSIYHDLKDEKAKARIAAERADAAERERDEFKQKLEAITTAQDEGKSTAKAEEDALTYAKENGIDVDPEFIKRLANDIRKGIKPETDEALKKDLEEFREWKNTNQKAIEQQAFDKEFTAHLPALQKLFPSATAAEMNAIKENLDVLSHSTDWADKDLDYIIFKHTDTLSTLVSPRRRGMESREKKDVDETVPEFDPAPDFSKMTTEEMDAWNKQFRSGTKSDSLIKGKDGKKLII